ncbi:hypothetical protein [uncultured Cohaesibacter sp.]|uniref:hypothetical protein n=1 Tax=uncultured Cohaesibacter sp. TaxID=1002546 RepID=UPI0029302026|nr:hypothetical protein [uncultured Cohaesibacter sp.]
MSIGIPVCGNWQKAREKADAVKLNTGRKRAPRLFGYGANRFHDVKRKVPLPARVGEGNLLSGETSASFETWREALAGLSGLVEKVQVAHGNVFGAKQARNTRS